MKTRALLLFLLVLLCASGAQAARKSIADLSEDFVAVTEGFSGAHLTVFGALKRPADVVIVIEGPPAEAKVRTKTRQFGLWINGDPQTLAPVPGYYAVISSRPVAVLAGGAAARSYGLALEALPFAADEAGRSLVESKKRQGLYFESPDGVKILDGKLFRASVDLPASVPIGLYQVRIYEFSGGALLASREETMRVAQVGFGAQINEMAKQRPLLYGLLSLALALSVGGGAAALFGKKG